MSLSAVLIPIALATATGITAVLKDEIVVGNYYQINTSMKDEEILQKALENRGSTVILNEEQIESRLGNVEIVLQRQEDDTISAIFHKDVASEHAKEFIENTYNEYTKIVQQQTYQKLLQRAENEGLILQSETTNEENTIVLTYGVKE